MEYKIRTVGELINCMKYNIKEIFIIDLEAYVYYVNIQSFSLEDIKWLPIEKVKRLVSYIYKNDKKRMIGGIITYLYGVYSIIYNRNNEKFERDLGSILKWDYNKYGKPFRCGSEFFNISHSGNYAICAFSKREVGVDIEKISSSYVDIATTFYSKEEALEVMKLENDLRPMKFIEIWVRKESFIKAVGAGMSIDFTKFFLNLYQICYGK